MKIIKAIIVVDVGMDKITFEVDAPNPVWPYTDNWQVLGFAPSNGGEDYVKKHFPDIEIKVINAKR